MKPKACGILPMYHQAANVDSVIPRILETADQIPTHDLHVLVMDDNSPDAPAGKPFRGRKVRRRRRSSKSLLICSNTLSCSALGGIYSKQRKSRDPERGS